MNIVTLNFIIEIKQVHKQMLINKFSLKYAFHVSINMVAMYINAKKITLIFCSNTLLRKVSNAYTFSTRVHTMCLLPNLYFPFLNTFLCFFV